MSNSLRIWFFTAATCLLFITSNVAGQDVRREISFPDIPGYQTLKCDLHTHTVFSDGNVWPTVRVDEAWRQGFDALSITDHIEYQPHQEDIPTQHNRPYEIASGSARTHDLILIRGAEITRDTPPGHFNALFLNDCTKLETPDFLDAIRAAKEQGAFVFWNHQAWKGEEKGRWMDVHTTLYEGEMLQGMEVANGSTYYPTAHRWCLEKNLTMMGNSDIHQPDLRRVSLPDDHRTITLVFATERTAAGIKQALLAGRTAVWFEDQLIGRKEYLEPLFHAAVQIKSPAYRSGNQAWVQLHNACDLDMDLVRTGGKGPATLTLPARSTVQIRVETAGPKAPLALKYTVQNCLIAPETGLPVEIKGQKN